MGKVSQRSHKPTKGKSKFRKTEFKKPAISKSSIENAYMHGNDGSSNSFPIQSSEVSSTQSTVKLKEKPYLIVPTHKKWYDLKNISDPVLKEAIPSELTANLLEIAEELFNEEVAQFNSQFSGENWKSGILQSGTLSDKIYVMASRIKSAPIHNFSYLLSLIGMMKKSSGARQNTIEALDVMRNLWIEYLLPPKKKLIPFSMQPVLNLPAITKGNKQARNKRLLLWFFEHRIKQLFEEFVALLEKLLHDSVDKVKNKSLKCVQQLLIESPENEKKLLAILVNKLGDPSNKIASQSSYLLHKILEHHPAMNVVIIKEVEKLVFRPHVSDRTLYYSLCFLTQLVLTNDEKEVAQLLLSIYFSIFRTYLAKGRNDNKSLSLILTGIARANPYASSQNEQSEELRKHVNELYKVVHTTNFSAALQALMILLQSVSANKLAVSERFYNALYQKLYDPQLITSHRLNMFFNVLFKSLRRDVSVIRLHAFFRRIMQLGSVMSSAFACGALFMISEVFKCCKHLSQKPLAKPPIADCSIPEKMDINDEVASITSVSSSGGISFSGYKPFTRNPSGANPDACDQWEFATLQRHYHPSVRAFASSLAENKSISYNGDPLEDFTLGRFLERFVNKKPRDASKTPFSVMAPVKRQKGFASIIPISADVPEESLPPSDVFLQRYMKLRKDTKTVREDNDEVSDISDDEFDGLLNDLEKIETSKETSQFLSSEGEDFDDAGSQSESESINETDEDLFLN